jgi:hypothetical protein
VAEVEVEFVFEVKVVHVDPLLVEYLIAYPDGEAVAAGIWTKVSSTLPSWTEVNPDVLGATVPDELPIQLAACPF